MTDTDRPRAVAEGKCMRDLVNETEGKGSLERPNRRWEDTKIDIKAFGLEGVDWIYLAQHGDKLWAVVNKMTNFRVPQNGGNCLSS